MSALGRGQLLHLRLFLEHVEVPVIGAMVSANEGSPAAAQVEIIPTSAALRLHARTRVELFFLDYEDELMGAIESPGNSGLSSDGSKGLPDSAYKLLFAGELFTMTYTKSGPGARSVILQCLDDSNAWDTSFMYQLNWGQGGGDNAVVGNRSAAYGQTDTATQFDDILNQPALFIMDKARSQQPISPSLQGASGILAGLYGILELVGGVEGVYHGVTVWNTIQEARVRLMDQIAGDSGKTAANLFSESAFENWLTGAIGQGGGVISFRQLLGLINSYVYYSVYPNPVGVYHDGVRSLVTAPIRAVNGNSGEQGVNPEFYAEVLRIEQALKVDRGWNGSDKPLVRITAVYRTLEARNNIRQQQGRAPLTEKPDMAHDWGFAADMSPVLPVRLGVMPPKFVDSIEEATGGLVEKALAVLDHVDAQLGRAPTREELHNSGFFSEEEWTTLVTAAAFYVDYHSVIQELYGSSIVWGGSWGGHHTTLTALWQTLNPGINGWDPVHMQRVGWQAVRDRLMAAHSDDAEVSAPEARASAEVAEGGQLPRDRISTQFLRPEVWFAPPPLCNVIFPEEVSSFSYTRQFMRETTRLELETFNALVNDTLVNALYYAPVFDDHESIESAGLGAAKKAIIYPHEKYSGVVLKMERMSEVSFFSRASQETTEPQHPDDAGAGADTEIEKWAQRTAQYRFLSHRYTARTGVCTMRFAPRLAPGWPCLVVDRPAQSRADAAVTNAVTPTHFLGMARTVSHSVTQAGGQTSVSLSHVRSYKTGDSTDDLFAKSVYEDGGVLSVQVDPGTTSHTTITVSTHMQNASELAFVDAVATHLQAGGELEPVPEVWKPSGAPVRAPDGRPVEAITLHTEGLRPLRELAEESLFARGYANPEIALNSLNISEEQLDLMVARCSSSPEEEGFFTQFSSVTLEHSESAAGVLPLEEGIRPPWISDEYSNENIGELYQKLLGCGSVIDACHSADPLPGLSIRSVEQAVDDLVRDYSAVSDEGASSSDGWIAAMTSRGYATLPRAIGTATDPGFWYYASGPFENLSGEFFSWIADSVTTQTDQSTEPIVDSSLDPRKGRYDMAVQYQAELLQFQGLRG